MLHWLVIIGLVVWAILQENRIRAMEKRLGEGVRPPWPDRVSRRAAP